MTQEEAVSWFNVCEERLRKASIAATAEAHWDMVEHKWANYMGKGKWEGVEQPPDMQWDTYLWDVCGWLLEFDCLWLQQCPESEIVAGPPEGARRRVAGDLGLELDVSDPESDSEYEDEGSGGRRMVLEEYLAGWSHGRGSGRVIKKADFGAARVLFGGPARGLQGGGLGGAGAVGSVPAPGIGGAVQTLPALPLTPVHASPGGGEVRSAGKAVAEDIDMGGTGSGVVAPAPFGVGVGCGCSCEVAPAGVRREVVKEVRRVRDESMGAISLLLGKRGLGTWEEGRTLENVRGELVK